MSRRESDHNAASSVFDSRVGYNNIFREFAVQNARERIAKIPLWKKQVRAANKLHKRPVTLAKISAGEP